MDKLPHSLLLQILSRLNDSADVARCRVASKDFNTVFPEVRSINLTCSMNWHLNSRSTVSNSSSSQQIKPFKSVFLDLLSKLINVESVCINIPQRFCNVPGDDFCFLDEDFSIDEEFSMEWLSRVSESLKSLSLCGTREYNALSLISSNCYNLVNLKLQSLRLFVDNLNQMPMLKSLTLEFLYLDDGSLNELIKCFPNLQVLDLSSVRGLVNPKIHHLNLQTLFVYNFESYWMPRSWNLITPKLITLIVKCIKPAIIRVEAPMLSRFHLHFSYVPLEGSFTVKTFVNLKTLWLDSLNIGSLISEFPITETIENLTLDNSAKRVPEDSTYSRFTLNDVFTVFPNVSSLCIKSHAWSGLEPCLNLQGTKILDGRIGLKSICAYLLVVDLSLTFSSIAYVLDQCVSLSDASFLIHGDVDSTISKGFMSKSMARWPLLNWKWGIWSKDKEDSWITNHL